MPSIVLGCSMAYIRPIIPWIETSVRVNIIRATAVKYVVK
jgi:hypothetical protein